MREKWLVHKTYEQVIAVDYVD